MIRKTLIIFILLFSILISGCSNNLQGVNSAEFYKRKDMVEDWVIKSPIVSEGKGEVKVISERLLKKTKIVQAPIAGSVYHLYQDLALKREDGFFPMTTTSAEAQYLITASLIYKENKKPELKKRMALVADRLANKVFYSKLYENDIALIHRATMYDFNKSSWIEKKEEVYVEDILDTIYAISKYTEVTGNKKHYQKAIELSNSIVTIQKHIQKENNEIGGALFYRLVNYQNEDKYYPQFGVYPFNLTESVFNSLSSIYTLTGEEKFLNSRDKYLSWVLNNLKKEEFWYEIDIPYIGINNRGKGIMYSKETWGENNIIDSEQVIKMIYGLVKWDVKSASIFERISDTPIGKQKLSKWYIPQYVTANGTASFQGGTTVVPEIYLLSCLKLTGENEAVKGLMGRVCEEQETKGDIVSKGVWRESALTNIKNSLMIIEKIIEAFN